MSLLEARGLQAAYGPVWVLHGVDLDVGEGEIVSVLGANGAGKTTVLRALSGMVRASGEVRFAGEAVIGASPDRLVRRGIAHVPEGRGTLRPLTVEENLKLGAVGCRDRRLMRGRMEACLTRFPRLRERLRQPAGTLSGGEQQMLAVGRALMSGPRLLLLDEPSLGLAPLLVRELLAALAELRREEGMAMLIVEQNAALVLEMADRAYVLERGRLALSGTAGEIAADDGVRRAYLGA